MIEPNELLELDEAISMVVMPAPRHLATRRLRVFGKRLKDAAKCAVCIGFTARLEHSPHGQMVCCARAGAVVTPLLIRRASECNGNKPDLTSK